LRRVRVAFMDVSEKAIPEGIGVLSVQQTKSMLDFDVVVWKMTSCLSGSAGEKSQHMAEENVSTRPTRCSGLLATRQIG